MIRRGVLLSIPLLIVMAALTVYGWLITPDTAQLPVHWDWAGRPRFAGKAEALSIMPIFAVAVVGLFALLPFLAPRRENIERSPTPYLTAWIGLLGLLTAIQATTVFAAAGLIGMGSEGWSIGRFLVLGVSVLFIALGNVLPKARSNWLIGVRTPWTLESERSWDKSQRLFGWLSVLAGFVGLAASFVFPWAEAMRVLLAAVLLASTASVVMSYVWWRNDPQRGARS
jgi:uncharacterized membrane protein